MTIQATVWAWEQRGLGPTEKLVLLALADSSSDYAAPADPESVAGLCELSTEEIDEALGSLRSAGLIDSDNRTVKR
jgi:hypothetical protein